MHGMMAVGILSEARLAQIIVLTGLAVEELMLRKFLDAAVAGPHDTQRSPSGNEGFKGETTLGGNVTTLDPGGLDLGLDRKLDLLLHNRRRLHLALRLKSLGCAVNQAAIGDGTLNQPVIGTLA
jgi:hypothetical protein